jgi:hypothetical protein
MIALGINFFKACFMDMSFRRKRMVCALFITREKALRKLNVRFVGAMLTLPTGFIFNYRAAN